MLSALWMLCAVNALVLPNNKNLDRRRVLVGAVSLSGLHTVHAVAAENAPSQKLRNLPASELAKIVAEDITERQFLVNGMLTRSIYDESCTFQDEYVARIALNLAVWFRMLFSKYPLNGLCRIDTYALDKWIVGTQKLLYVRCVQTQLASDSFHSRGRLLTLCASASLVQ